MKQDIIKIIMVASITIIVFLVLFFFIDKEKEYKIPSTTIYENTDSLVIDGVKIY